MTERQRTIFWLLFLVAVIATAAWIIAAAMSTPAHACHRFSVWKYPYPQRCAVQRVAQVETPPSPPEKPADWPPLSNKELDIPLPSLEGMEFPPDCLADWCQRLKGIGMLRDKFGTN